MRVLAQARRVRDIFSAEIRNSNLPTFAPILRKKALKPGESDQSGFPAKFSHRQGRAAIHGCVRCFSIAIAAYEAPFPGRTIQLPRRAGAIGL